MSAGYIVSALFAALALVALVIGVYFILLSLYNEAQARRQKRQTPRFGSTDGESHIELVAKQH